MFIIGPVFIAFLLVLANSLKHHFSNKPSSLKKLAVGMGMLLTGALGIDFLTNFVENKFWVIAVAFEEGLEMIGATVMLWAVYEVGIVYMPGFDQKDV